MEYRRIRLGQIGSSDRTAFAVSELVRFLKKMDPELVIDVLKADSVKETYSQMIWVGIDKNFSSKVPEVTDPSLDDAVVVDIKDSIGYITGSNDRSVLLAVYRFLKELGCEWVRPGVEGERIPHKKIEHLQVSVCEVASYRHRGVCIEGANTYENVLDMIDFLPKVGMNEYFIQFLVPSTFFERWYHHEGNPYFAKEDISREEVQGMVLGLEDEINKRGIRYHKTGHGWTCEPFGIDGTSWDGAKEYPISEQIQQYLAEVNGKRELWGNVPLNTNLCYSNPEVRERITDAITDYCRANTQIDVLHFWLADESRNHCECEACAEKRPADWYVMMLNELDEKLTEVGLDTKIVFLVYLDLLWEPQVEVLRHRERFVLMFAPITRNYGQNYSDYIEYEGELPSYVRNQILLPDSLSQNLEHLRRWQAGFAGDSFDFDYHLMWAHLNDPGYERCARNLFQDMKDLKKIGLNGMVSCQVQRSFFPTALPFQMMAAVLWDADTDYDEKASAYYRYAFGTDGELVRKYLMKISDLMLLYEGSSRGLLSEHEGVISKDKQVLLKEIDDFQTIIQRNLSQEDNGCYQEWKYLGLHSEYLHLLIQAMHSLEADDVENVIDFLNRVEMDIQKVFDVHNAVGHWKQRIR